MEGEIWAQEYKMQKNTNKQTHKQTHTHQLILCIQATRFWIVKPLGPD